MAVIGFIIKELPGDIYIITLVIGKETSECKLKYAYKIHEDDDFDFNLNDPVVLPATGNEYKMVRFEVEVPEDKVGDIGLLFYGNDPTVNEVKSITCITVEGLGQYVGFEEASEQDGLIYDGGGVELPPGGRR